MLEVVEMPAKFVEELDMILPFDETYDVYLNGSHIATLVASPGFEREMALGLLLGSRSIVSSSQIEAIAVENRRIEVRASGEVKRPKIAIDDCVGMIEIAASERSAMKVKRTTIEALVEDFHTRNRYHGVQACGIYDLSKMRGIVAFDVSRFASVAKAIGASEQMGFKADSSIMIASGRISGDMVAMALGRGMPVVVGFKSIMYSALRAALMGGVTVILSRGKEMKVLSYPWRVID